MTGRTKCRMHGGKNLAGPAHPNWIDGTHSNVLPKRMLDDYKAAVNNPNVLALGNELALADARIADLLRTVDRGESGKLWRELIAARKAYSTAQRIPDKLERGVAMEAAAGDMCDLIDHGAHDWAAWDSIFAVVERRRRLVDTERKRLVDAQQMMQRDQVLTIMGLLVDSVAKHVDDDDARAAIVDEFIRLTAA